MKNARICNVFNVGLGTWGVGRSSAQSVLEYAILLFVLCTVFIVMFSYMRRSIQAKFFVVQERVNDAAR